MIERELPVNLVRGVLAWVVGLIAIPLTALPFVAYAHYSQEGRLIALHVDRAFRGPAFARLDKADAKYVASNHLHYSNAVLVLNVHAVMDGASSDGANPESSVLPVRLFAADMQMLRDAGYNTVTPEQITAWRAGVLDLPHDALLLTFDDGRTDTVLNAAPILRRVGMRATVFAIGDAWKRSPLYEASPEGLRSLQRQGWSIEAHASAPHGSIDAGDGESLPFLSARRSVGGRLETLAQFRTRAAGEYRKARLAAEKIANRPVVAFAWPFGAYGADTRTNDPRVAEINLSEARRVYSLGFNEDGQTSFSLLTRASDPMRIARFEIVPTLSPRQLFERLELAIAATAPEVSRAGGGAVACGQVARAAGVTWPPAPRAAATAKWHTRRVPLGLSALLATALCTATATAADSSPALPVGPARGRADRARPDGDAPLVGGARIALGAPRLDRAARSGLALARGRRAVRVQRGGSVHGRSHRSRGAARAGARRSGSPRRRAAADGPMRRRLAMRLAVALRALGARGIVLDWRDLPATARGPYAVFVHELRVELGQSAAIVVTVPAVRTARALREGAYDLRALARPARLLVLAWNEHGPRSEPGPVASLAFWKQTLRTVLRAAPRSRVLMGVPTWGWRWNAGAGAEQATQAQLFPHATETAMQRPYGARVGERAWVESDRSVQLKLLVARQARIGGVALWVRGGESSAIWSQPLLEPLAG